jgi:hypothetical protein
MREDSTEGFYLALQAAPNQRPHGHNDSGSFIVFHDGSPLFVDIGPEAYTAPRYKFSAQSAFHNLPTIGGIMQSNAKPEYRATNLRYASDDTQATISMNLATAYPAEAGIAEWTRTLRLLRAKQQVVLNEDFQLQKAVPVQLSFMTPRIPSNGRRGELIFTSANAAANKLSLRFDPTIIAATIEPIALTDSWLVSRWGNTIYRVLLSSSEPVSTGKWNITIA